MNKQAYRINRASIRANGLYALRWLDASDAAVMLAATRAPMDALALRADVAATERKYGNPRAARFAFMVTRNAK